jgi:hypothetical protein
MSIALVTDRAEGVGRDVDAKPNKAIPVRRPSAWPGSNNSVLKISRQNSTGFRSKISPVEATSIAAAVQTWIVV